MKLSSILCALAMATEVFGANSSDWRFVQQLPITKTGLVKINLPLDTLDAARSALEDLRVLDDTGAEVPYLIESALPNERRSFGAKAFQTALTPAATVITLETGSTEPVEAVVLNTSATSFIKAVQLEGSRDNVNWTSLVQGQPIFRQANGASQLRISFTPDTWSFLRVTVDDRRATPVPFTGAEILTVPNEPATEPLPVAIAERSESPSQTRLLLQLPAAHLRLARIQIETAEPLFSRLVTLAVRQVSEHTIQETRLATGVIYRAAAEGYPVVANTSVRLEARVASRELLLLIDNHDSPPLPIASLSAQRRPVFVVFHAGRTGTYQLLTGNSQCPAPNYDMTSLSTNWKSLAVSSFTPTPLTSSPAYRPAETLPTVAAAGTALDVAAWIFRKPIQVSQPGWQQLELDLEVMSGAQAGFQDLRIAQGGQQIPYVLERTSINRSFTPQVSAANDPEKPKHSRWQFKLPYRNLPVHRLVCGSTAPLFQREMLLYEQMADERGRNGQLVLGRASWRQTPDHPAKQFDLSLSAPPRGDTFFLETDNGDNPAIALENFQCVYLASRLFFKAAPPGPFYLYYGNAKSGSPQYDLSLVADQLLKAEKNTASLAAEERLKGASWQEKLSGGASAGFVFWGVLGAVVIVLLVVINRLLPKQPPA
jgi:hypothetical protein